MKSVAKSIFSGSLIFLEWNKTKYVTAKMSNLI